MPSTATPSTHVHRAAAVRITGARLSLPTGRQLFDNLQLTVARGEFLVLLGPSGSGKSTLLRTLAGLEQLEAGAVEWHHEDQPAGASSSRRSVAMVFQDPHLYPWLTVAENVALGQRFRATRDQYRRSDVANMLEHFGVADLAEAYPEELSGGQAQRVAVLRAVAVRPRLLLLDEPFSALDPATRDDLQQWLARVVTELGTTAVLVTHDVDEAITLADRIAVLTGSGEIDREWVEIAARRTASARRQLRAELLKEYRR